MPRQTHRSGDAQADLGKPIAEMRRVVEAVWMLMVVSGQHAPVVAAKGPDSASLGHSMDH
jgi:hypothetical protein